MNSYLSLLDCVVVIVVSRNENDKREKEEINLFVLVIVKDDENELVDKIIIGIDIERINENKRIIPVKT